MNRKLLFFPASESNDHGVDCLELRFTVEGKEGMVELQLLTQWYLPHVMDRRFERLKRDMFAKEDFLVRYFLEPNPIDLCYFSESRRSEDDTFFEGGIHYFRNGVPCYYGYKYADENGNVAKNIALQKLVAEGDESLWKYLEDYYTEVFGEDNGHQ